MTYRLLFLIGLASLAAAPALPDIIDVTVSGSVSGSGTVLEPCDPTFTQGCMRYGGGPYSVYIPYSFNGTNTQIGSFSASSGPTVSGPGPGGAGFASENTSLCLAPTPCPPTAGDAIYIELTGGHSAFGYYYTATESAGITISFDLTQESEATLYSGVGLSSGGLMDSNGDVLLPIPQAGPASTVLPPGAYQLKDSDSGGSQGTAFSQTGDVTDFDTFLTAQFTPVPTPEPRGAVFGALALMLITFPASRRRRAR